MIMGCSTRGMVLKAGFARQACKLPGFWRACEGQAWQGKLANCWAIWPGPLGLFRGKIDDFGPMVIGLGPRPKIIINKKTNIK